MNFDKYETRGSYHYQWYEDNTFNYKDCVDKCVKFCQGSTLDVGCGDGVVTNLIGMKYIANGIDSSPMGIRYAIQAGTQLATFMIADLYGKIKGKWEYMVCLDVIEHLERPERIKEIFKKNITKGAIIITDIPQKTLSEYHVHEFTPKELLDIFSDYKVEHFKVGKDFHGVKVYK